MRVWTEGAFAASFGMLERRFFATTAIAMLATVLVLAPGFYNPAFAEDAESDVMYESMGALADAAPSDAEGTDSIGTTTPAAESVEKGPDEGAADPDGGGEEADGDAEEEPPAVTAQVSRDERRVALTATGDLARSASSLSFDVWREGGGRVRHSAVRLDDGTWTATVFIASPTYDVPGLPYSCDIDGAVHRLLNPSTGQHLYTADGGEADSLSRTGWNYEGIAWVEPDDTLGALPIYRLYNRYTGDHLYTADPDEYASLYGVGWNSEGVAFHSDPMSAQPVYRLFNPYAEVGSHHFTTDASEVRALSANGWLPEGVCWFGAGSNAEGTWSLPSGNAPVNDYGTYHVEAIAVPEPDGGEGGEMSEGDAPGGEPQAEVSLGETSFSVARPTANAHIANVSESSGTFDVVVSNVDSVSGIARVEVPVWSAPDQGDIVWYLADPQPDGTYRTTVRAQDHGFGHDYQVHVYLRTGNGLHVNAAQTAQRLELANFLYLSGGPNRYELTIVNPGPATTVRMPTWSEANGQDDLVWYEAERRGDRWTATIDTANLLDSGDVVTHVYVDDDLRVPFTFSVSPKEVMTLRQRAIVKAAEEVPTLGGGLCAGWVSTVLMRAGLPFNMNDDADDMYYRLHGTNLDEILPGMAIAVSTHGHTWAGSIWGHVGIYLGNGVVIDDAYGSIRHVPLDDWVAFYTDRVPVHFGFLVY